MRGAWECSASNMGRTEAEEHALCNSCRSGSWGATHGSAQEAEVNSRPSPPLPALKEFRSPPARPHPYAFLLGKTVAVDVDLFPYFRDEQVVSVYYIYITWTKSASWARKAWPVQW